MNALLAPTVIHFNLPYCLDVCLHFIATDLHTYLHNSLRLCTLPQFVSLHIKQ
jgi:hypothetical protein